MAISSISHHTQVYEATQVPCYQGWATERMLGSLVLGSRLPESCEVKTDFKLSDEELSSIGTEDGVKKLFLLFFYPPPSRTVLATW